MDPHDALRGLYISDEQAIALVSEVEEPSAPPTLSVAAERLALGAIDRMVLALCAAPELILGSGASTRTCTTTSRASWRALAWRPSCSSTSP